MKEYNHQEIEKKWQKLWAEAGLYLTKNGENKPKFYALDMFPYPSGVGLHVGHPKGYIATDIIARLKMMQGFNVLHPMGFDSFGLPAENYALKTGVQPGVSTAHNVKVYKEQLEQFGCTYDWSREINTVDPEYYKWTQWAFLEMFKKGLVFESHEPINWCPSCKTGLANEDVEDGKCERCGTTVEKKPLRQWVVRITDYAERLLKDLDTLPEWDEAIKEMQRNWLGKSSGAEVNFSVIASEAKQSRIDGNIKVFTTRPDTIFGATYLVLAPEHELISNFQFSISNAEDVNEYIKSIKNKSDLERTDLNKNKTGVELKGIKAINPANGAELPIFIADYVLASYGTGAIMAVPAHDERDFEFAQKYNLEIKPVLEIGENSLPFCAESITINSDFLNGLKTKEAKEKILAWLEDKKLGERKINWKLKDWVFSRQRYWGEPIPLIFCEECKKSKAINNYQLSIINEGEKLNPGWFADENLPLELPVVEHYEPSGTGESPLANITEWVNVKCPRCGVEAKRETNTMPQWAGSSWYYLRYMDPHNSEKLVDTEIEKYWNQVDLYVGGAEHATRHLIYARFWHKFLFDIGAVSTLEPFKKMRQVGLILAEDGRKMSKRWNNVVNPDDICSEFGADSLRIYEMFMGPFEQAAVWNTKGLIGARKFLLKIIALRDKVGEENSSKEVLNLLHKTIKKVEKDIVDFKFNTAVSALMILVNKFSEEEKIAKADFAIILKLVAPFAPHITEELWQEIDMEQSVFLAQWPKANEELMRDEQAKIVVQINGKLRDQFETGVDLADEMVIAEAKAREKTASWLAGKKIIKEVVVKNKLINFVVE